MKQLEHFASLQVKPALGWRGYAIDTILALGGVALITGLISVDHLYSRIPMPYSYIAYLFLVVALASTRGLYAALLASLLAFLFYVIFLVPDVFTIPIKRDLLTLCVFLATAIIVAAAHQRAELARRRERELRILYEQAQELASLQERQRLARELHDSVSQALYGIGLGAQTAREALESSDTRQAIESLEYVIALTEAGLVEMRALIFELRPESLETEGLVAALTKQVAVLRTRHKLTIEADLGEEPALSLESKESLYRIAQEATHNIIKHAHASFVMLRLARQANEILLEVADNGRGFDPTGTFPGHLGLRSIRERVARNGGTLTLESASGQGTYLRVQVPLEAGSE
jgi:signal transduction histidine kinase